MMLIFSIINAKETLKIRSFNGIKYKDLKLLQF